MEPKPPQSKPRSRPSSGTKSTQPVSGLTQPGSSVSETPRDNEVQATRPPSQLPPAVQPPAPPPPPSSQSSAPQPPSPPPPPSSQSSAPQPPPPPPPPSSQSSAPQPTPPPPPPSSQSSAPQPPPPPPLQAAGTEEGGSRPGQLASQAEGIIKQSKSQNNSETPSKPLQENQSAKQEFAPKIYRPPEESFPSKKGLFGKKKPNKLSIGEQRLKEEALSREMKGFMFESSNLLKTVETLDKHNVTVSDISGHIVPHPDQLLAMKRKLKTVNKKSRFYPVKLGRRELLKDYDWNMDYLPIPVVLESVRNTALTADLVSLDFTGIEQLTDYLFYIFKITKSSFPSMQKFVTGGCVHLTDQGLAWASQLFPKVSAVEVHGCSQITEKGIYMLAKNCPDLHKLTLTATNVGRLPSKLAEAKVSTITCEGCPIISSSPKFVMATINALKSTQDTGFYEKLPSYKIVILRDADIDVSVTSLFTGSADKEPSPSLIYTNHWLPDPRMKLEGKFNLMEVPVDSPLQDAVISSGCMVVITFTPTGQNDLYNKLAARVAAVLSKCRDIMVILMAVQGDNTKISVEDVLIRVKEKLGFWKSAMENQYNQQTKRFWRLECVDFVSQISQSAGAADYEALQEILKRDLITGLSVSKSTPDRTEISDFLYKNLTSMCEEFPWIFNKYRKEALDVITEIRPRTYWNLEKVFNNIADDAKKILNPRNCFQHVGKLLELMRTMGTALYYGSFRDSPCMTDLPHLQKVLLGLHSTPQKIHIKCLGPDIPCWGEDQLQNHLQSSLYQVQAEGLQMLLIKLGILLPFPTPDSASKLYILSSHLPTSPAVELAHLWSSEHPQETLQADKFYTFLPAIPVSLFPSFIRKCMKLFPPLLVWKTGLLLQQGPVSVLVELTTNKGTELEGSPVIVLSARLPYHHLSSHSSTQFSRKCLFATLNTVCHILDYLLKKYNVCAFVTTPCVSCMTRRTRETALHRQDVYHFDVDSILAGHDRGIVCRYEREQKRAKIRADKLVMLGEDIPSIVPYHNYSYLSAVNPVVETGDPGEDEAEEESAPRKKVTVTPRIRRCCVCSIGQDRLCHHCGMCQTCIQYLAKIENYVKPSFVTPNLVAMRDVTPGKDGSVPDVDQFLLRDHISTGISGCVLWPNKGMEYHILQPMTSTYFNTFIMRPVRGSNLSLRVTIKGYDRPLEYDVLSGAVADVNMEVESDESWKCRDGYTVSLQLQETKDPGMLEIVFYLCTQEIWRKKYTCSEVFVRVRAEVTGCVILHAPGIKRRQGPQYETGMQVGIIANTNNTSPHSGLRIGEIAVPDESTLGLLRIKPVHTPVTEFLVKIQTGDKENCGTNANVYIQLFSDKATSDKILLKKTSEKMFQRNSEDEFSIHTQDLGDITQIKLSHDGMEMEDSWYVKNVVILTPVLDCTTSFSCNRWLSAHMEDKHIERTFYPHASQMKGSLQETFSPLSFKLQPLTLHQWKAIMGNKKTSDDDKTPVLAPSWLFYETQMKTDHRTNVPATVSNVNQFIMPCTDVPLPSVVWCKMMKMRDKLERTLFQYSRVDFSGTASILLPQQVTEKEAEWPSPRLLSVPTNMHPVCYVRGDMSTVVTLRPTYTLPDYMCSFWTAHIVKAPGFPFKLDTDLQITIPLLWAWHFVLALNKQFKLPDYKEVFPNCDELPSAEKVISLLEVYLTQMCYHLFLSLDPDFSMDYFSQSNEDVLEQAVGCVRYPFLDNFDKSGLLMKKTLFGEDDIYLCSSHFNAWQTSKEITEVPLALISDYSPYMLTLHLQGNRLTSLPKELFSQLPHLKDLDLSSNILEELPEEIGLCTKMLNLSLSKNHLVSLPDSMSNMSDLNRIDISNNRMIEVPPCITKLKKLVCLYMKTMQLNALPDDIGNLTMLEKLYLNENCIHSLPASFKNLTNLKELALNGVSWTTIKANTIISKRIFENILKAANLTHWLLANEQDKSSIFRFFDENTNGTLEPKEIGKLNATIFYTFARFGYMGTEPPDDDMPHGFPEEILHLRNLEYLSMQYQGLVGIPDDIDRLKKLKVLNLSHNPYLLSIPAQTGNLPLKRLELEECPLLKTPPKEIRSKGFVTTYAYLKRLLSGSVDCQRTKLMMVGLGGAGKTSLVKALLSGNRKTELTVGEDITDGIDICPWTVTTDEGQVTYSVWDFAGQTVYYNTHQFFLSDRAIYMLLWNIRLGHEHAGLDFWLSSITVHAPKAPIFVVGTHVDQVSKVEIPMKAMQSRYPQIAGFHFVSSHSGQGVKELQDNLMEVTLQQSYMGEKIPGVWLSFEEQIKSLKGSSVIEYKELEKKANLSGIFSQSEVYQAVQFLHELGSLQYFTNEYLKNYVVVNPQWIVDVMACVVSVKDSHIKDGRLQHRDIPKVWKDYPETLHSWMIRLTEEFDLTFPLASEEVNLVPCLLPEREPEFTWPELDKNTSIRETKMVYKFDYLPAGLFNRGQVRLHQFSDSAMIWKRGSFLRKNKHICLIQQTRESEMLVLAQGPRPENIVFLVHEVFETLIAESFQGVTYDYLLPCPDCLKLVMKDPHMFAASTIRRATELRAPFLQCLKYFHTISIVELQGMMPPDSNIDYDVHLVQAVQGLKELSRDLVTDIFVSYCSKNTPESRSKKIIIHPSLVCKDLEKSGFRCWYREDTNKYTTDEMAKALMDAEVVLVFISNDYVKDEGCCNLFKYARLTLQKPIILVVVGDGMEWKSSRLGILLADEVFVSMLQPDRYKNKFDELMKVLQVRMKKEAEEDQEFPPCFISYCWKNSAHAVARGTKTTEGAVGFGDPRAIKQHLDNNGVPCWLDVERVGLHGLFEDIAEGLLHARLVIVCVSDEYASSSNCCMEFRYAANTLKLPVVMAVVGTGNSWRASEIGVLSMSYPLVSFQENNKNAFDKLLTIIQNMLPDPETYSPASLKAKKNKINEEQKDLSYQELCELAQRKFLRQIVQYADEQDIPAPYPRLFLVDFVKEESSEEEPEKGDVSRVESQVQGHRDMFKHPLCVHILCEHEEGWHSCSDPLPMTFNLTTLETCVPYIARITAIARYSKKLALNCLGTTTGREFIKWVEENPQVVDCSDFRQIYHDLRQEVIQADPDRLMGKLARCHLPNGKTVWLCEEHRNKMRVTVLSDEVTVTSHGSGDIGGVDYLLQALKELDYQQVPAAIRNMAREKITKAAPAKDKAKSTVTEESVREATEQAAEKPGERTGSADSQTSQQSSTSSILQAQGSHQTVSAAQRSLKTRRSVGPPRIGNRSKSRACSVM